VIVLMALRPQGLLTRGQLQRLFAWRHAHSPARDADGMAGHIA
jgi:hypothetical protein